MRIIRYKTTFGMHRYYASAHCVLLKSQRERSFWQPKYGSAPYALPDYENRLSTRTGGKIMNDNVRGHQLSVDKRR